MRQSGWFLKKLKEFVVSARPNSSDNTTKLQHYIKLQGFYKNLIFLLIYLNEFRNNAGFNNTFRTSNIFKKKNNFFINTLIPKKYDFIGYYHICSIISVLRGSYSSWCILHGLPSRGQREWSNAHTVKLVNPFIKTIMKSYELDFYKKKRLKKKKKSPITKLEEARFKAKYMPKKKKQRKWNKFKKVGQRRLQKKLKKKTPWQ